MKRLLILLPALLVPISGSLGTRTPPEQPARSPGDRDARFSNLRMERTGTAPTSPLELPVPDAP